MKLNIPPDVERAIQEIASRIQKMNPYANTSASAVTGKVLLDFLAHPAKGAFDRVADELTSPAMKRKALLEKLSDLAQQDESVAIRVLEKGFRKLDRLRSHPVEDASLSEKQT